MKLFICVDDTDDLTKETSTGKISDLIAARIVAMGGKMEQGVTRHQLLLHEDIDYTSHNSSMCVLLDIGDLSVEEVKQAAEEVLRANMSAVSDPGLCFCRPDELRKPDKLIAFGRRAQQEVIQKE
ncbi:MAG: hypothetical protein RR661_07040, partial [Anaerovoracaceae bacterium]